MSNFAFLTEWATIQTAAQQAESLLHQNPRVAAFLSRLALERMVKTIYRMDSAVREPYSKHLDALINEPSFVNALEPPIPLKLDYIKRLGNRAAHSDARIESADALQVLKELHHVLYWFNRTYGTRRSVENQVFNPQLIPNTLKTSQEAALKNAKQIRLYEAQLKAEEEKQDKLQKENAALKAELEQLRRQTAATKQANRTLPDIHQYNEAETRQYLIDEYLREVGWEVRNNSQTKAVQLDSKTQKVSLETQVSSMPNKNNKGFVDYVLWGEDGKPLAVVEAKRASRDASEGRQQAKLYADALEKQYQQRPIIYYTNGLDIYCWDDRLYPPRKVHGFRTADQLARLIERRRSRDNITHAEINRDIAGSFGRTYQEQAIKSIATTFEQYNRRKALLVMATGTGKTRTAIALVDLLSKRGWVKNVLFLADRNALISQAKKEFGKHLPHLSPTILSSGLSVEDANSRLCFATYPTMMNMLSAPHEQRLFGVGHFDLVIVDEAHRSVYRKYRAIFDYFDALLVGLTATPKADIDKNTYSIFELADNVPTFAYELDQAIEDKFLVPPRAYDVPLKFMRQGIKFAELPTDEQEQWEEKEALEAREEVLPSELNKFLFNESTVDKVLEVLMRDGIKVGGGDVLGKTIIFAANDKHARFIAERFDQQYPTWKGHFARVITYSESYAESLIDTFKAEKQGEIPLRIAISVDMLDTGIDVPEVVNLVFFKVVRSKTKFAQMIGRGTRLAKDLFAPDQHKTFFKIFDYCQNFEFFQQKPEGAKDSTSKPLSQQLFEKRLKLTTLLAANPTPENAELRAYCLDILHHHVAGMRLDNFIVRPQRAVVEKYQQRAVWNTLDDAALSELIHQVGALPSEASAFNEDEQQSELTRRFDNLLLQAQLMLAQQQCVSDVVRLKIIAIAEQLERKSSLSAVQAHLALIQAVQTEAFWQAIALSDLEKVRRHLRHLLKFLDKQSAPIVYTQFTDDILWEGVREVDVVPILMNSSDLEQYRKKLTAFVRSREDHLTIQRLKRGIPITASDLEALDQLLFTASGLTNRTDYEKVVHPTQKLGVFIRHIVGLERHQVLQLFSDYLANSAFNAEQIQFINTIIDYLCVNGVLEPAALFEPPFTDLHSGSVLELFGQDRALDIRQRLTQVNQAAEVA